MTQRYRLFLWVFITFSFIFLGTFLCETVIDKDRVGHIREDFSHFYTELQDDQRGYTKHVVTEAIFSRIVQLDASLGFIESDPGIRSFYEPTDRNLQMGTWQKAAELIQKKPQLDFLQNSYEGKVLSLITPMRSGMHPVYRQQGDDLEFCWIRLNPAIGQHKGSVYIGVLLSPNTYVVYDAAILQTLAVKDLKKKMRAINGVKGSMELFVDRLSRVQSLLKKGVHSDGSYQEIEDVSYQPLPSSELSQSSLTLSIKDQQQYDRQLMMIQELCALAQAGVIEGGLCSSRAPTAICFFPDQTSLGSGLLTQEVFSTREQFPAERYFQDQKGTSESAASLAIFAHPDTEQVYIGNVIELQSISAGHQKKGYLTMGFDADALLQEISGTLHQMTWMIHNGQLMVSASSSGKKMALTKIDADQLQALVTTPYGTVSVEGKPYYYVHVQPFAWHDVHVYVLKPAAIESARIDELKQAVQKILKDSSRSRDVVVFLGMVIIIITLLNVTKKITRPIVAMARAARLVGKGRLEDIQIPLLHLGSNNEVQILRDSFAEMIEGLKEKEKVKGILNKVVSPDIAKEILKGDIHLGGEERVVTILFADIRHFTSQTQNMEPQQVIKLLNTCMTRLDAVIEAHQGVIDKYVGDEIMVLFGAPIPRDNSALDAIACAIEMVQVLALWNQERALTNLPSVRMGIGIHTGKVLAGNMGAENRLNYTVIGKNVNLASRICSAAAGDEIYISHDTLLDPHVTGKVTVEALGEQHLKGFDKDITLYRVIGLK
jgi:class 3 adenylate cyclase/HAMP domain-containing protein